VSRLLTEQRSKTCDQLEMMIESNKLRINYDHPLFNATRVMHEVELRKYGDEETPEETELLRKAHSGAELTPEERARLRGITERRIQRQQKEEEEKQGAGGGGGAGGLSGPMGRPTLGRSSSTDLDQKIHAFLDTFPERERVKVEQVIALTEAYFEIMQTTVKDQVPKYVQLLLVEKTKGLVTREVMKLTSDAEVEEIMSPSEESKLRRAETQQVLTKLHEAHELLFTVSRTAANRMV